MRRSRASTGGGPSRRRGRGPHWIRFIGAETNTAATRSARPLLLPSHITDEVLARLTVSLDARPPGPQPARDLRLVPRVRGLIVDPVPNIVRHVLLRDEAAGMVVRVAIALAVAEGAHAGHARVAKRRRYRPGLLARDVRRGGADRAHRRVALGRGGDVERRLRHRDP